MTVTNQELLRVFPILTALLIGGCSYGSKLEAENACFWWASAGDELTYKVSRTEYRPEGLNAKGNTSDGGCRDGRTRCEGDTEELLTSEPSKEGRIDHDAQHG